jgi:transcriptional regulator with XRE-family HTH domain
VAKDPKKLAANMRRYRMLAGLTQAELAERAGIADATVSRIERGRLTPSVRLAERIASALDLAVDDLVGSVSRPLKNPLHRAPVARLVALVRDMSDAEVDDVTRAVKTLLAVGRRTEGPTRRPA